MWAEITTTARRTCTIALVGLFLLLPAAPAVAHGDGDSAQSRVLVLDALTYLANRPAGYMEEATDKIGDALEAPDQSGVDLADVEAAQQALMSNDMMRARSLLEHSLAPVTGPVTGVDPGTTRMPDPLSAPTTWDSATVLTALFAAVAVLTGLALALRWRPSASLGALRAQSHEWRIR